MFRPKFFCSLSAVVLALSIAVTASAAGTVNVSRVVGGYRLTLQTGPALPISQMGTKTGAMQVGGKQAACHITGGGSMSGGMTMHGPTCNHFVAVHVLVAKTNKVVLRARVTITMKPTSSHATIAVPVSMMVGPGGLRDYEYGNDVSAAAGRYSITVTVNGTREMFSAELK